MIFAYWGLSQLMFGMLELIVAIRYKSLIPLMYLMLVIEWGGRFVISLFKAIKTVEQAPGETGNQIFPILCLVMFFYQYTKDLKLCCFCLAKLE